MIRVRYTHLHIRPLRCGKLVGRGNRTKDYYMAAQTAFEGIHCYEGS